MRRLLCVCTGVRTCPCQSFSSRLGAATSQQRTRNFSSDKPTEQFHAPLFVLQRAGPRAGTHSHIFPHIWPIWLQERVSGYLEKSQGGDEGSRLAVASALQRMGGLGYDALVSPAVALLVVHTQAAPQQAAPHCAVGTGSTDPAQLICMQRDRTGRGWPACRFQSMGTCGCLHCWAEQPPVSVCPAGIMAFLCMFVRV